MRLAKPVYYAEAEIKYTVCPSTSPSTDGELIVRRAAHAITGPEISGRAARNPDMQAAFPFLRDMDLANPNATSLVTERFDGIVEARIDERLGIVTIATEQADPVAAATLCNAYAIAFMESIQAQNTIQTPALKALRDHCDKYLAGLSLYNQQKAKLLSNTGVETRQMLDELDRRMASTEEQYRIAWRKLQSDLSEPHPQTPIHLEVAKPACVPQSLTRPRLHVQGVRPIPAAPPVAQH